MCETNWVKRKLDESSYSLTCTITSHSSALFSLRLDSQAQSFTGDGLPRQRMRINLVSSLGEDSEKLDQREEKPLKQ